MANFFFLAKNGYFRLLWGGLEPYGVNPVAMNTLESKWLLVFYKLWKIAISPIRISHEGPSNFDALVSLEWVIKFLKINKKF